MFEICTINFLNYFYNRSIIINSIFMKKSNCPLLQTTFCLLVAVCLTVSSCQLGTTKTEQKTAPATDSMAMQKDSTSIFDHLIVDNKKDPSCGMPVTAGIADTAHYKNKVLGFCSKECKAEFLKNPEANLAAAELKK